ncbi:MAG TPA: DNA topoisomerase I [Solirubrobacterales bacterium]
MRLIITEKNNSAKKIAEILSGGEAKADATYKVPFYTWSDSEGDQMTVGLKGHVMGVAFPEGYSNWQETDLHELIDAELVPEPTDKNVVKAVRKLAKEADAIVIATDFDREGELIGLEALAQALEANPKITSIEIAERPPVERARYSALTKDEIERAFSNLDQLSYDLAYAGSARQDIDLIWGATLTRAVSLASRRFGSNFLSVGRVQSPTLALIVERELERRAHVPKPFWELFANFSHPDGSFEAHHATDKFWDTAEADAALAGTSSPGVVKEVTSKRNTRKPPTPLNTTAFTTDASSRLGITPAAAMRIAEDLYMDGFISYPRTDNTVYPASLNTKELVTSLVRIPDFDAAKGLLDGPLQPTRGKKETTDHPPIYPTQAVYPNALDGPKRRVYELVVRRFLATFSPPMITESTRADIEAGSETYFVRGSVVVDPGYAGIYTYARSSDEEIPALVEGQSLELDGEPWIVDKETQPPSRISQGKLIELMEERGLGTKATRADIIQELYDRGYAYANPPIPSETGIALYKAFHEYVPRMATPEMTAELESDMDQIAAGETSKEDVVRISREMLHTTTSELEEKKEELAKQIWQGMDEDKFLGPCKVCEEAGRKRENGEPNRLRIIDLKGGKRMYGCEGWKRDEPESPDSCPVSGPLPGRFFELWRLEERCSVCGERPRLTVKKRQGGRPWKLCLNDDCPTMVEMREKRAEREAQKQAREAAKAVADTNGEAEAPGAEPADAEPAKAPAKGGARRRPKKPAPTTARTKRARSST